MVEKLNHLEEQNINALLSFLDQSPSSFHAADNLKNRLSDAGFKPLDREKPLKTGDQGFIVNGDCALFAFRIGTEPLSSFRLVGTHLDSPGFLIKPDGWLRQDGWIRLQTEIYGSPILESWFDRPLGLAGRVFTYGSTVFNPEMKLVKIEDPVLTIPRVAIHLEKKSGEIKRPQLNEMYPVLSDLPIAETADPLKQLIARDLAVPHANILEYDLFLYDQTPAIRLGPDGEMIQSGRLDNLALAHAAVMALIKAAPANGIQLVACFDHEEVGSRTAEGAGAIMLRDLLEQIVYLLSGSRQDFLTMLARSYLVSADQAHAFHPNYPDRSDQINRPQINCGPVIKYAASRSYTTSGESAAIFKDICTKAGITLQSYTNHPDIRGGSTIGPLLVEHLPFCSIDIGNPIWGMHSARETGGLRDQAAMTQALKAFFKT